MGGGGGSTTYMYQSETTTYKGGSGGAGGMSGGMSGGTLSGGSTMDSAAYGQSTTADYDMAIPSASAANYQSNTLSSSAGGTMGKGGYSTMSSSYNYQVR